MRGVIFLSYTKRQRRKIKCQQYMRHASANSLKRRRRYWNLCTVPITGFYSFLATNSLTVVNGAETQKCSPMFVDAAKCCRNNDPKY
ncbi:uncharacterized protein BYT42DRAFT_570964 [Radiomyces spectabilis]|uniref:uncharacterized protein n=1 Tax=Radiomyces spectabilis TaxID=64574 RepID=UPI00221E9D02|nr:uncharacterized protein BYT42DRAFT_570964 [Radiomyces spectabilis]KAI8377610.1 hypothetical protein BYT42DRAFT_570964 [Radiomyces spectabilis]